MVESRRADAGAAVRRRRECVCCSHRFTTFERIAPSAAIVHKRDGRREEFDPQKLRAGLERATHKLPDAATAVKSVVSSVEIEAAAGGELSTRRIGEICLEGLRHVDRVAYLRFASVHKQLADTEAIRAELSELDLGDAATPVGVLGDPDPANADNFDPDTEQASGGHAPDFENTEPGRKIHA